MSLSLSAGEYAEPKNQSRNGAADQFYFINKPRTAANFTIQARVDKQANTHARARAGVMVRASLNANSRHASMAVTPGNGIGLTVRAQDNAATTETSPNNNTAPYWIKVVKAGNTFTGYMSPSGADDGGANQQSRLLDP